MILEIQRSVNLIDLKSQDDFKWKLLLSSALAFITRNVEEGNEDRRETAGEQERRGEGEEKRRGEEERRREERRRGG